MTFDNEREREGIASELTSFFTHLVLEQKIRGDKLDRALNFAASLRRTGLETAERKAQLRDNAISRQEFREQRRSGQDQFLALCNEAIEEFRTGSTGSCDKLVGMLELAKQVQALNKEFDAAKDIDTQREISKKSEGLDYIYGWLGKDEVDNWQKKLEELGITDKPS